jgi:AcrR family transcriptional regulator/DNA-binding MarR family transcriptional regulator
VTSTIGRPAGIGARRLNEAAADPPAKEGLTVREIQRARILAAMSTIVSAEGVQRATVTQIINLARVPRGAFYENFSGRDDALRALVEHALERSRTRVREASEREVGRQRQTRAGLDTLLALYEAEPDIGRLCLIHSHHPGAGMRRLRSEVLSQLARHVAAGANEGRHEPGELSAECTVAGVLGVLEARLGERGKPRLSELAGELMSFIVLPYRGAVRARAERARTGASPTGSADACAERSAQDTVGGAESPRVRITYRTMRVLAAIGSRPGLSNVEVAEHSGIVDQGQISKLLKRLQAVGLVQNAGDGPEPWNTNAWRLTEEGQRLQRTVLDHHLPRRP